jgi:hypothetical protein
MALQTFSFKIDDALDPDVVEWLRTSENRSVDIRKALRHYLDLPPRSEDPLPTSDPQQPSGIDGARFDRLLTALEKLVGLASDETQTLAVPTIPLYKNGQRKAAPAKPAPVEPERSATPEELEQATGNFLSAFG